MAVAAVKAGQGTDRQAEQGDAERTVGGAHLGGHAGHARRPAAEDDAVQDEERGDGDAEPLDGGIGQPGGAKQVKVAEFQVTCQLVITDGQGELERSEFQIKKSDKTVREALKRLQAAGRCV